MKNRGGFSEGMRRAVEDLKDPKKAEEIETEFVLQRLQIRINMGALRRAEGVALGRLTNQIFKG